MVIWSNPAKEDLKRIYDYIAQDSQFYAKQVVTQIIAKADSLLDFPKMVVKRRKLVTQTQENFQFIPTD